MEASWNRIRTISGAETAEDVIAYWEGLKAKEEQMRELVKLAEAREAAAKSDITRLLESRAEMFERPEGSKEIETDVHEQKAMIDEAQRRMEAARGKFSQLRSVSISAEQGLNSIVERLMIALDEVPVDAFRTGGGGQSGGHLKGLPVEKQRAQSRSSYRVGTPERKATLATPRQSASPNPPAEGVSAYLAEANTLPEASPTEAEASELAAARSAPETSTAASALHMPAAGNTIEDDQFFPELPEMFSGLADRLAKVMLLSSAPTGEGTEGGKEKETDGVEAGEGGAPEGGNVGEAVLLGESEKALTKGMQRRTWAGPPLLDTIGTKDKDAVLMLPTMKRKKGKKKSEQRIMGYNGSDISEEEESSSEEDGEEEENLGDGVIERDVIKLRAYKMSARHASK
eukprot:gene2954-12960_t